MRIDIYTSILLANVILSIFVSTTTCSEEWNLKIDSNRQAGPVASVSSLSASKRLANLYFSK